MWAAHATLLPPVFINHEQVIILRRVYRVSLPTRSIKSRLRTHIYSSHLILISVAVPLTARSNNNSLSKSFNQCMPLRLCHHSDSLQMNDSSEIFQFSQKFHKLLHLFILLADLCSIASSRYLLIPTTITLNF